MRIRLAICCLVLACAAGSARSARASFHLWKITDVFSDSSGKMQFIQLGNAGENGENFLGGHAISSNEQSFTFPTDLPSDETKDKFVLLATSDFAKLSSAPKPDYVLAANFFDTSADSIDYAGVNTFSFTSGQLPTDGVMALLADKTTATNSPTNFAGVNGSVMAGGGGNAIPLPPAALAAAFSLVLAASGRLLWVRRITRCA